jgi:hypothetical protein
VIALLGASEEGASSPQSYFVPGGPVWCLVRERQSAWGYSDKDMACWLRSPMEATAVMARLIAEGILRRLCQPAPANARMAELNHRLNLADGNYDSEAEREAKKQGRIEAVRRAYPAGTSIDEAATELGLALSTVGRIAKSEGLSFRPQEIQAS